MIEFFKIIITSATFFVWFIRYENIKKEFKDYNFPNWLRDLVGILEISFSLMIHSTNKDIVIIGLVGIFTLMIGAILTHFRMKNRFKKYLASTAMLTIACLIFLFTI